MGSVHSKEASQLKAPYVTVKHGLMGLAKVIAKEGRARRARRRHLPGFVRTPLVDKRIPEQAQTIRHLREDVIKKIMLKDTVDGEFTTVDDIAEVALFSRRSPPTRSPANRSSPATAGTCSSEGRYASGQYMPTDSRPRASRQVAGTAPARQAESLGLRGEPALVDDAGNLAATGRWRWDRSGTSRRCRRSPRRR